MFLVTTRIYEQNLRSTDSRLLREVLVPNKPSNRIGLSEGRVDRKNRYEANRVSLISRRDELKRFLAGELSCIGSDEDEESLDDEEYVQLAESESKELEQIEASLQRMREGSYGQCEECGEAIADARLEALPCATLCIVCQRAREQGEAE